MEKNEFFLKVPTFVNILVKENEQKSEESKIIGQRLHEFWN
jgi:hypothetical protein